MAAIDAKSVAALIGRLADVMTENSDELCRLDGVIGDADHGIAMSGGFKAAREAVDEMDLAAVQPSAVLATAAKTFLNAVGASTGPLYATAMLRASAAIKGQAEIDGAGVVAIIAGFEDGIRQRGKADLGEKTMLDAWGPGVSALKEAWTSDGDLKAALSAMVGAAEKGAEATKDMIASKGRSSRLGERSLGHIDPGAASAVMIMRTMAELFASD